MKLHYGIAKKPYQVLQSLCGTKGFVWDEVKEITCKRCKKMLKARGKS